MKPRGSIVWYFFRYPCRSLKSRYCVILECSNFEKNCSFVISGRSANMSSDIEKALLWSSRELSKVRYNFSKKLLRYVLAGYSLYLFFFLSPRSTVCLMESLIRLQWDGRPGWYFNATPFAPIETTIPCATGIKTRHFLYLSHNANP